MDRHTRAPLDRPAEHPGAWVSKTTWVAGFRVTWKRTRCNSRFDDACACASDDPSEWHGPYPYVHVPNRRGTGSSTVYLVGPADEDNIRRLVELEQLGERPRRRRRRRAVP